MDKSAIENLRTYLQIPSVHPNIDYGKQPCLNFLRKQAEEIGLVFAVYRPLPNKPHAVLTWLGKEPTLPTVVLNSHMDVVPVFEDLWTHKPFAADVDENGIIYARGIQDIKTLGIQYLEAIRRLKQRGFQPKRTVHVTFAADEETGGQEGMKLFVKSPEFKALNVGFAMDECVPSVDGSATIGYGEKRNWKIKVRCPGQAGHGSLFVEGTAGEKVQRLLNKFYEFRADEVKFGDLEKVVSVNLTMVEGGLQANVLPPEIFLTFDARVPVERFVAFEALVKKWCEEAGNGLTIEEIVRDDESPNTKLDASNVYWIAFKATMESLNIPMKPRIFIGNTDGRHFRAAGVPTIGYSNIFNTENRAHNHDECLSSEEFLRGIERFEKIVPALANA
ncbi:hypothetical protein FQR65_LT11036 [Abscondita terminalis]|nr:hypothetical protein FQR65_LT11036 [Abscondita terminalis]